MQEVTDLARKHTTQAIERLVEITKGTGMPAVRACEVLLERAWGKVPQSITTEEGGPRLGLIVLPPESAG